MQNLSIQKAKNNTAWVFPGQSSQKLNMAKNLLANPFARAKLKQAQKILGWSIPEICQDPNRLSRTLYTQPCLFVVEALLAELMKKQGYKADILAGYSLGEYAAIYAAGGFDFETGLNLIRYRAELMDRTPQGKMAALVGFNQDKLEHQLLQIPNVWQMNDDLNLAIVSGTAQAVDSLIAKIEAKRVIPLNVSCAFHTPLMGEAADKFEETLQSTSFKMLKVPVVSSTELIPTLEISRLKENLIRQMCQPVRWRAISLLLANLGIEQVVEIGPGKDLIKQMKRTCPELTFSSVSNVDNLRAKPGYPLKLNSNYFLRSLPSVIASTGFCNF